MLLFSVFIKKFVLFPASLALCCPVVLCLSSFDERVCSHRIEIQYKHLLTLWRNRHWHLKQALSASGAPSGFQVVHTVAGEKVSFTKPFSKFTFNHLHAKTIEFLKTNNGHEFDKRWIRSSLYMYLSTCSHVILF